MPKQAEAKRDGVININRDFYKVVYTILRYFVPQIPITGKMLNGYLMFPVKNIAQNVKLIEL